jgi:hypothetical protein
MLRLYQKNEGGKITTMSVPLAITRKEGGDLHTSRKHTLIPLRKIQVTEPGDWENDYCETEYGKPTKG